MLVFGHFYNIRKRITTAEKTFAVICRFFWQNLQHKGLYGLKPFFSFLFSPFPSCIRGHPISWAVDINLHHGGDLSLYKYGGSCWVTSSAPWYWFAVLWSRLFWWCHCFQLMSEGQIIQATCPFLLRQKDCFGPFKDGVGLFQRILKH